MHTNLWNVDPDESFSVVPYEKGYLLLRALEQAVGRERWERWLRSYLQAFRFSSLTTQQFVDFLRKELPDAEERVDLDAYLSSPGIPADAPRPRSARLDAVLALPPNAPDSAYGKTLTPLEWKLYLDHMPRPTPLDVCRQLDERFGLTQSGNAEIAGAWLRLAIASGHDAALSRLDDFLAVGRMKFLKPMYTALMARPELRDRARQLYRHHEPGYHPIARQVVGRIVGQHSG